MLHVLGVYPPDYGGGAAITTSEVCRALAARGHEIRVLCVEGRTAPAYSTRRERDGRVEIVRLNLPYFYQDDPEGFRLGLRRWRRHERRVGELLRGLVDEWRPDLVDYHTTRPLGEACVIALAERGVPVVATLHDFWLMCPRVMLMRSPSDRICAGPGPLRCLFCVYSEYDGVPRALAKLPWRLLKLGSYRAYRLQRRAQARARIAGAVARSAFVAEAHRGLIQGPVAHIPLGVELLGLPARRPSRPRTPVRFGFVAGSQPSKGLRDVLAAARALRRSGLAFELHVWGPFHAGSAEAAAAAELFPGVRLRGLYAAEKRWDVYAEMDVALMATSVCEPLGRVPIEAAAAGVPTIAPAVGGIVESIRDEVDGLLFAFRSGAGLEERMRRVIQQPALVRRLAANLRAPLDTADAVSQLEVFYQSVLSERARRAAPAPA